MTEEPAPIPVMRPRLPEAAAVLPYLQRMDANRVYSNSGPLLREFEEGLAEYLAVDPKCVVACSSATVALQGACASADTATFAVPSFTFPASAAAVLASGKATNFVDIESSTWRLDHTKVSRAAGAVVVMPFGAPLNLVGWSDREWVVIDAAASLGAGPHPLLQDLPPTWAVVYSLHATKILGIGEGGFGVFPSADRAQKVRSWLNFGFDHSRISQFPGINGKLSEIGAAYGIAAISQREIELDEWHQAHSLASEVTRSLGIEPAAIAPETVTPYWIVEFGSAKQCARAEDALKLAGIATRRWWSRGCHQMPAFRHSTADQAFPVTDDVSGRTLGLPMFRDLRRSQTTRIQEVLAAVLWRLD